MNNINNLYLSLCEALQIPEDFKIRIGMPTNITYSIGNEFPKTEKDGHLHITFHKEPNEYICYRFNKNLNKWVWQCQYKVENE